MHLSRTNTKFFRSSSRAFLIQGETARPELRLQPERQVHLKHLVHTQKPQRRTRALECRARQSMYDVLYAYDRAVILQCAGNQSCSRPVFDGLWFQFWPGPSTMCSRMTIILRATPCLHVKIIPRLPELLHFSPTIHNFQYPTTRTRNKSTIQSNFNASTHCGRIFRLHAHSIPLTRRQSCLDFATLHADHAAQRLAQESLPRRELSNTDINQVSCRSRRTNHQRVETMWELFGEERRGDLLVHLGSRARTRIGGRWMR